MKTKLWRQYHVALTLGCAPITVGERASLPWQQHSEQAGHLYWWGSQGLPHHSSAANLWSHGDWSGMRDEEQWHQNCPWPVKQTNKEHVELGSPVIPPFKITVTNCQPDFALINDDLITNLIWTGYLFFQKTITSRK